MHVACSSNPYKSYDPYYRAEIYPPESLSNALKNTHRTHNTHTHIHIYIHTHCRSATKSLLNPCKTPSRILLNGTRKGCKTAPKVSVPTLWAGWTSRCAGLTEQVLRVWDFLGLIGLGFRVFWGLSFGCREPRFQRVEGFGLYRGQDNSDG